MLRLIRLSFYLIIPFSFVIVSCNTFDPPLVVPVYGHIDSIHFMVPPDSAFRQGTASANITYAWVYLDDNPVGAFQLPCTFPMIASNGAHIIEVYPGVTPVGATSPASIYPIYQTYSININLQQGNTYNIKPTSVYNNWVEFPFKESFNEPAGNYPVGIKNYHGGGNAAGASTTTMTVINSHSLGFAGHGSGMVIVNKQHPYYIGMTWPWNSLPDANTPVYMELNYRSTAEFTIGMFDLDTTNQSSPIAIVYPSSKWTKMYVALNNTITTFRYIYQNIYFTIGLDSVDGHTSDTLLLANIKILD